MLAAKNSVLALPYHDNLTKPIAAHIILEPFITRERIAMIEQLLIATGNAGKQREYATLLAPLPCRLVWPQTLRIALDVAETGQTYAENAWLKADAYRRASGLWSLADDSGLEVDALDGAPGIRSARYAGHQATDGDRYRLLLERLTDVSEEERTARFRCVICLTSPQGERWFAQGTVEGIIASAPQGVRGFGYDPVFFMPQVGMTMAQLDSETKNQLGHRGQAAAAIVDTILGEILPRG